MIDHNRKGCHIWIVMYFSIYLRVYKLADNIHGCDHMTMTCINQGDVHFVRKSHMVSENIYLSL